MKVTPTRWVDVNKGSNTTVNMRSRLVAKELKVNIRDSLLVSELLSAILPWVVVKAQLSILVTG